MNNHQDLRFAKISADVELGEGVRINEFVNLYGCRVGDHAMVGTFVEIQKDVDVGAYTRVQSHTFICSGVTLEDHVFVGHGVMFINDRRPSVQGAESGEWTMERTRVKSGASIGSGCVIMGGLTIGRNALIGAGAVVLRDVADGEVVAGVPARSLNPKGKDRSSRP